MTDNLLANVTTFVNATFPSSGLKVALTLALFSTWIVVVVHAYLNLHTRQACFRWWSVGWLYFSMYFAAQLGLEEHPGLTILVPIGRACVGVSALCMIFGGLHLAGRIRPDRELGLGSLVVLVWSFAAAHVLTGPSWVNFPTFLLVALAAGAIAAFYARYWRRYKGAVVVSCGLLLWSVHQLMVPWEAAMGPGISGLGHLASAALALWVTLGMIMSTLEEARARHEALVREYNNSVAQRRLLEEEVQQAEQKYRALFDSAGDAIFLVDLATLEIVSANAAAEELAARKADQLIGRPLLELCPKVGNHGESLLENKKRVERLFDEAGEFELMRRHGEQALCEGAVTLMNCVKEPVLQINAREITARKKMESQLRQAEKLSGLGQLVAGVAHELNNPLAVVMGYTQLLVKHKSVEERVRKDLLKVLHESERAAKIVRNLLTFARPREPHLTVVDVNQVVADALETRDLQAQSDNIMVERRLTPDLPPTMADAGQIEQVLVNLVTNAIQALDKNLDKRIVGVTTERHGERIRIIVADNGPGIPPHIIDKIFDPFFTTKGPGKGTGLGLSICYSIMEEHKGKISAESTVGKGTRFIVELPIVKCVDVVEDSKGDVDEVKLGPDKPSGRLLIVDDEPGIVDVLKTALDEKGYRTETAANGTEALARIASQDYDLIISDLCMPEMGGEKLFAAICEQYPHLSDRIVFVTGDTVSPASRTFLERSGARWLNKPFDISDIERLVANHLRVALVKTVHRRSNDRRAATVV